jgi:HlyD family secretion protein
VALLALLIALAGGSVTLTLFSSGHASRLRDKLPHTRVRRADLNATVYAGGQVESAKQTLIECELENVQFRSQGHELNVGGSAVVLWLIPDGSVVKEGDLLCRLDSSDYEEIVDDQQIKVEEARANKTRAELTLQVAKMAVQEYQEGLTQQIDQDYRGQIALARTELQRFGDRLAWTERMHSKGYASLAQLATDRSNRERARINLQLLEGQYDLFRRFETKSTLRQLTAQVEAAEADFTFQKMRLARNESRLKHFKSQVAACTVRAPHDGFVIYARRHDFDPPLEEGMRVHQRQPLFYLPDLSDMEVLAVLSESTVDRIRKGQPARIRLDALPDQVVEGAVVDVGRTPMWNHWMLSQEVKNYVGRVRLHSVPRGLKPGMTAQVEILTGQRPDALVIPPAAVAVEDGQDVCYVDNGEGLERREITVGSSTREFLEVTEGLAEGEAVVLDPIGNHVAVAENHTETVGPTEGDVASPTDSE